MIRVCGDNRFELYYQDRYYGYVKIEDMPDHPGVGNFHIHITRFSHNILNRMRRDEISLMNYIRSYGYDEMMSCIDVSTVKHGDIVLWTKFIKLFEFEQPKLYTRRTV